MGARFILGILGCLAGLGISVPASADSVDASMPVSGSVVNRCGVRATPMTFGTINPQGAGPIDATATVTLRCTVFEFVRITMDNGQNAIGSQRRMVNQNGEFLEYQIYANAGRTQRWGPGAGGFLLQGFTLGVNDIDLTAYGRIPNISPTLTGTFSDVITVTVEF
ncbi:spore coat protein U domain-containing protein [Altererythrobacter sp. RZ02]|uniref:Spore coat protein U domain-containing protein n=1 Tax=Pontixanthobacter rizhaonensis TaxID=2730337 RepID=A0A848QEV8_9SPHN|nr:spore coat protein U domain-containing protein [Pontixanthobacter rizhaonensis]